MTTANAMHSALMEQRRCTRRLAEGWEEAGDTEVDQTWSWIEGPEVWEGKHPQITAQAHGAEDLQGGRECGLAIQRREVSFKPGNRPRLRGRFHLN